jgi:lysophospholipase L1-like esterase
MARRRILRGAAIGGGGLGGLGLLGVAVIAVESKLARRAIGEPQSDPPRASGIWGPVAEKSYVLALLGDSSAAGLGVHRAAETPGVLLAAGLAEASDTSVRLVNAAVVGARSSDLEAQIDVVLPEGPDVAVIMVGANDVTHRVRPSIAVAHLGAAVRRLRDAGVEVVVGTCPDLGTIEPIAQPLRLIARRWSRRLAAAQTVATVQAGGRSVSLGDLLGPEFDALPRVMFGPDRFHPSAAGYAAASAALLPSVCAALQLWPEIEPTTLEAQEVLPLGEAALAAAEAPGTEVSAVTSAGRRGRLASIRHRIPRLGRGSVRPEPAPPAAAD